MGKIKQIAPPTIEDAHIDPARPTVNTGLIADYEYLDLDGNLEGTSEIRWYKRMWFQTDFFVQGAYNDQRIIPPNADTLNPGSEWYFEVRPYDGIEYGGLYTSDFVVIYDEVNIIAGFGGYAPNVPDPDEVVDLIFYILDAEGKYYHIEVEGPGGADILLYHSFGYIEGSFFLTDPNWRVYTEEPLEEGVYTATLGVYHALDENNNPVHDSYCTKTFTFRIWEHVQEIMEVLDPNDYPYKDVGKDVIKNSNICYHLRATNSTGYNWWLKPQKEGSEYPCLICRISICPFIPIFRFFSQNHTGTSIELVEESLISIKFSTAICFLEFEEQDFNAKSASLQALLYFTSFLNLALICIWEQRFSISLKKSGQPFFEKFSIYLCKD